MSLEREKNLINNIIEEKMKTSHSESANRNQSLQWIDYNESIMWCKFTFLI